MRTFFHFWQRLVARNAALADPQAKITLTVEQLQKNMQKAYDQGWTDRRETMPAKPKDQFAGLFGGMS